MQCLREMLRRPAAPFYPSQGKRVDLHPSTSLFAPIGKAPRLCARIVSSLASPRRGPASESAMIVSMAGGRAVFHSSMNIVDLRQTTVRQLEPLLDEEARHWREELHWDYRGALELIKRFLEARALAGCVAFDSGVAAGYCFYVLEEQKGLIGGLYISPQYDQAAVGRRVLEETLFGMRALPHLTRIEAQLMPFGGPLDEPLKENGFRLYTRQFMLLDLQPSAQPSPGTSAGMRLDRWHDRYFDPCAKLLYLSYANHLDGEINDQYRNRSGALRFLKNIMLLPGCGQFVPSASFLLRQAGGDELIGAVLTSEPSPAVGPTPHLPLLPRSPPHP